MSGVEFDVCHSFIRLNVTIGVLDACCLPPMLQGLACQGPATAVLLSSPTASSPLLNGLGC